MNDAYRDGDHVGYPSCSHMKDAVIVVSNKSCSDHKEKGYN